MRKKQQPEPEPVYVPPPPAFTASVKVETLRTLLDVIGISDTAIVQVGADGIHSRVTDPARVCHAYAMLQRGAFESFQVTSSGIFAFERSDLCDFLKLSKGGDIAQLCLTEKALEVTLGMISRKIPLGAEPQMTKVINLSSVARARISVEELRRFVRAGSMVTDHLRVVIRDNSLIMIASAGPDNEVAAVFPKEYLASVEGEATALFPQDYVTLALAAIPSGSVVRLSFGDDLPLEIETECAAGMGAIYFALAPRIENE
jgi:DNA polymerase III sliding clamp (beta) subunit (PCNA family)